MEVRAAVGQMLVSGLAGTLASEDAAYPARSREEGPQV